MALQQGRRVLAAGETVENLLAGLTFERAPWPAALEIAVVADSDNFEVEVTSGADVLMPNGAPSIANRIPIFPDDFTLEDVVQAGELIRIRARNTDVAAHTINFGVRLTPVQL